MLSYRVDLLLGSVTLDITVSVDRYGSVRGRDEIELATGLFTLIVTEFLPAASKCERTQAVVYQQINHTHTIFK